MKKQKSVLYVLILSLLFAFAFAVLVACPGNEPTFCDHVWDDGVVTKAVTCTEDGSKTVKCEKCGITKSETIRTVGHHQWDAGKVDKAATCFEEGSKTLTCTVEGCGRTKTEKIQKLDHEWATTTTVIEATETTRGMSYIACTRQGCNGKKDITGIAPTGAVKTAKYRIYINRGNGKKFPNSPTVNLTYPEGNVTYPTGRVESIAATSLSYNDKGDSAYIEKELPLDTYTVSIPKLQEGFESEEYYTITQDNGVYPYDSEDKYPTLHINLYSNPLTMAANGVLGSKNMIGDVVRDFKFTAMHPGDWEPQEYSLGEILSQYKMVWFNFYYNDCPNCVKEHGDMSTVYNQYKDDVALIMFNDRDGLEKLKQGQQQIWKMPNTVFFVDDSKIVNGTEKFAHKFGKKGVSNSPDIFENFGCPTSVFIDNGGYIVNIKQGYNNAVGNAPMFRNSIEGNLFWTPKNDPDKKAEAAAPNLLAEVLRFPAAI